MPKDFSERTCEKFHRHSLDFPEILEISPKFPKVSKIPWSSRNSSRKFSEHFATMPRNFRNVYLRFSELFPKILGTLLWASWNSTLQLFPEVWKSYPKFLSFPPEILEALFERSRNLSLYHFPQHCRTLPWSSRNSSLKITELLYALLGIPSWSL